MTTELSLKQIKKEYHGTLKSYLVGFLCSLILTAISFSLVMTKALSQHDLIYAIVGLALLQAIVQLIFFLHVGKEPRPQWESFSLYFMILVLLIIALGSLWIMSDLNERVMSEEMMHD